MTLTGGAAAVACWLRGKSISILREEERESIPNCRKQDRVRNLLFASNALDVVPPSGHPRIQQKVPFEGGHETYGHEYSVLLCLKEQLPARQWEFVDDEWDPMATHALVCLGSGASNLLTKSLVGDLVTPRFHVGNEHETVRLPYGTNAVGGDKVWHLQHDELYPGGNSAIVAADGSSLALPQLGKERRLIEDYLLVSRIPGRQPGTTATIFAGLHDPGTRATELAVANLRAKDADYLAKRLNWNGREPVRYFQAVFRASDFEEVQRSWVPRRIECVTDACPPQILERIR